MNDDFKALRMAVIDAWKGSPAFERRKPRQKHLAKWLVRRHGPEGKGIFVSQGRIASSFRHSKKHWSRETINLDLAALTGRKAPGERSNLEPALGLLVRHPQHRKGLRRSNVYFANPLLLPEALLRANPEILSKGSLRAVCSELEDRIREIQRLNSDSVSRTDSVRKPTAQPTTAPTALPTAEVLALQVQPEGVALRQPHTEALCSRTVHPGTSTEQAADSAASANAPAASSDLDEAEAWKARFAWAETEVERQKLSLTESWPEDGGSAVIGSSVQVAHSSDPADTERRP